MPKIIKEPPPKRRGRPPHDPEAAQRLRVERLVIVGTSNEVIARVIGVNLRTLHKHYGDLLETAAADANATVARALFRLATDPKGGREAVQAAMFWLKSRAGWRDIAAASALEVELGKKEQQQRDAVTAAKGTGTAWERILQ